MGSEGYSTISEDARLPAAQELADLVFGVESLDSQAECLCMPDTLLSCTPVSGTLQKD